jgi:hypothetical protein
MRRVTGERPAPVVPDEVTPAQGMPSLAMPLDQLLDDSTAPSGPAQAPQLTRLEAPATAVAPKRPVDPAAEFRAAKAKQEAERAARSQKLVRNISLGIFAVVAVLLLFVVLRPKEEEEAAPTTRIWVTSKPPGATIKLNDRDVGKTPLEVHGVIINQANTLVLTLPNHLAWTKRFTPDGYNDPPIHADLKREVEETLPPPPATAVKPATSAADAGTSTDAGTATAADDGKALDFHEVVYPTRLLVLRAAYNAFPISEYTPATIDLSPGVSYSVRTEGGGAAYTENGASSSTLAYFLEGDLPVDDSFGVISGTPRVIKGARKMHVFALDETPLSDNRGTIRIQFSESKWKPPRYLTFDAQKHALWLKREHQVWLHGLNPKSTYLFTVRDDFAELRKDGRGRIRRALCMHRDANPASRPTYRILETGKRYWLDDLESLRCTFPDTRLPDNEGALEVDLVDVTNMTRKEREEYIRNTGFDR